MRAPLVELNSGQVHVWATRLSQAKSEIKELAEVLSPDERSRANRFLFDRDRERFTIARGVLRRLLAQYADLSPEHLQFRYGKHGKPRLHADDTTALEFNLSHAGDWAVYALTTECPVGIDIEQIRPANKYHRLKLARRFFSESEFITLAAQPETNVERAFFACWTRKEAYIKLHGRGLSLPLARFSVNVEPDDPARLMATPWLPEDLGLTQMHDLPVVAGYRAALALSMNDCPMIRRFDWPTDFKDQMTLG